MNKFVFVAPAFNAAKTMRQFMLSLAAQSYQNWDLVLIDDMSTDMTAPVCSQLCTELRIMYQVHIIHNSEKLWEVANVLKGINSGVISTTDGYRKINESDIICRIDPDDYLCDVDALKIINDAYNQTGCDVLWTKHRWFDERATTSQNISGPLPVGVDPYKHPWVSSHLKTFRKSLITGINDENFKGSDGAYIKRAGDQAIFLPILHRAKKKIFLPLVTYAYRCDMSPETFQTDDAKFQAAEAQFLRQRGFIE